MRGIKIGNYYGGMPVTEQREQLKKEQPTIVVGTPGRVKQVGCISHFAVVFLGFAGLLLLHRCPASPCRT